MLSLKRIFFIILMQAFGLVGLNLIAQTTYSELAYLQTDRTFYIGGETVYYKVYILNAATKECSDRSRVGYLDLINSHSDVSLKIRFELNGGMANGSFVLPDSLKSGTYQIVAFTSVMKNHDEKYFNYKDITIVNRFDKLLNFGVLKSKSEDTCHFTTDSVPFVKTDKDVYGMREKVTVDLSAISSKANVVVSVSEKSPIYTPNQSIADYIAMSKMAQAKKKSSNDYSVENKGKILRGKVVDAKTHQTIKDAVVLLSCIDSIPDLQYAATNSKGSFQMLLSHYYDGKELFLTIMNVPENQDWKIEVESNFTLSEKWNPTLVSNNERYKDFIGKSQNIAYVNKVYHLNNNGIEKHNLTKDSICYQFYHSTVTTIYPSDFLPLPNFFEIAVEILPQVRIVKSKKKYYAQIMNSALTDYDMRQPAIFLDGVYVDDINKILDLGTEQIKKIDLITNERAYGDLIFGGLISITSKSNAMITSKPASYSLRLMNENINTGERYLMTNPDTIRHYTPYVKQLLYWNPNLVLEPKKATSFVFYTSDNLGNYTIKIEGITKDGKPISSSCDFQVVNKEIQNDN